MIAASSDAKEKAILEQIKAVEQRTMPLIVQVRRFRNAADKPQAEQRLLRDARPAFIAWLASIDAFIDLQEAKNREAAKEAVATARGFAILMVISTIIALLLGAAIAFLLTRSVVLPLRLSLRLAERINEGDLRSQDTPTCDDESGQLLRAMQQMQRRLQDVISAQRAMAARHDAGEISYSTDAQRFPGEYGDMVQDTNALVHAHVQTQLRMTEVMGNYAIGNFAPEIEQYPGEKTAITATMQQVRQNLYAINAQIQQLTQAACAGNFALRGQPEKFEHDFRLMVENLNTMMAISDTNLAKFSGLLRSIAEGDLTVRMSGNFHGVFASMRDDADSTVHRLTDIVTRIQTTSNSISFAAEDIASANQELARRSDRQAANPEETAASMEELTSTVKQNAEHEGRANQLALGAAAIASEGREVVGQVIEQMSGIAASSKRIADIISVIDGIAFQTNILALNAAVEAARAGEQGRGFAVVASEVRTLSHRSSDAAKQIKRLIDDSVQRVADGATLVRKAGTTMGEVVTSVQHVTDIIGHISAASQEQAGGIELVVSGAERVMRGADVAGAKANVRRTRRAADFQPRSGSGLWHADTASRASARYIHGFYIPTRLYSAPGYRRPARSVCLLIGRGICRVPAAQPSCATSSASCTALSAAPLRMLSETIHRFRPRGCDKSSRMRPTNTASLPEACVTGVG